MPRWDTCRLSTNALLHRHCRVGKCNGGVCEANAISRTDSRRKLTPPLVTGVGHETDTKHMHRTRGRFEVPLADTLSLPWTEGGGPTHRQMGDVIGRNSLKQRATRHPLLPRGVECPGPASWVCVCMNTCLLGAGALKVFPSASQFVDPGEREMSASPPDHACGS